MRHFDVPMVDQSVHRDLPAHNDRFQAHGPGVGMKVLKRRVQEQAEIDSHGTTTTLMVEFVGMPGSGKSSLCGRVAELLRQQGFLVVMPQGLQFADLVTLGRTRGWKARCRHSLRIVRDTAWLAVRNPDIGWRYLRFLCAIRKRRSLGVGAIIVLSAFQGNARSRSRTPAAESVGGIFLVDEGPYVAVAARHTLQLNGDDVLQQEVAKESRRIGVPHIVVFVECDPSSLMQRISSRPGHPRSKRMVSNAAWFKARLSGFQALQAAVENLESRTPILSTIRVWNGEDGSIDENAHHIARFIESYLSGAPLDGSRKNMHASPQI